MSFFKCSNDEVVEKMKKNVHLIEESIAKFDSLIAEMSKKISDMINSDQVYHDYSGLDIMFLRKEKEKLERKREFECKKKAHIESLLKEYRQ